MVIVIWMLMLFIQEPVDFQQKQVDQVVSKLFELEKNADPRCLPHEHQVLDQLYGTPLTLDARHMLREELKSLSFRIFRDDNLILGFKETGAVAPYLPKVFDDFMIMRVMDDGSIQIMGKKGLLTKLSTNLYTRISNLSQSLWAILALQQESMLLPDTSFLPLDPNSLTLMKKFLDLCSLIILEKATNIASKAKHANIVSKDMEQAIQLFEAEGNWDLSAYKSIWSPALQGVDTANLPDGRLILYRLVEENNRIYEPFNSLAMSLFVRNFQVFFARYPWPEDTADQKAYRQAFSTALTEFAWNCLSKAVELAKVKKQALVRVEHVEEALTANLNRQWDGRGGVIINLHTPLPKLPHGFSSDLLHIENWDVDAFNDTGLPWRYLDYGLQNHGPDLGLEPDPFALEALTQEICHYGLALLRLSGALAEEAHSFTLEPIHMQKAISLLDSKKPFNEGDVGKSGQSEGSAFNKTSGGNLKNNRVESSPKAETPVFVEKTQELGLSAEQGSADWVQRQIRSYQIDGKGNASKIIPPFQLGSGVACEDLNGDGRIDFLVLSGQGNQVFYSDGKKGYKRPGSPMFDSLRSDGSYDEPRQALIADLDNDGRNDVFINFLFAPDRIYKNLGDGHFIEKTGQAGLGSGGVAGPAICFDFNGDGLLDLVTSTLGTSASPRTVLSLNGSLQLWQNNGDMTFRDVTAQNKMDKSLSCLGLVHTDWDGDGIQDLLASDIFGALLILQGHPDGTFQVVNRIESGLSGIHCAGIEVSDIKEDGSPEIISCQLLPYQITSVHGIRGRAGDEKSYLGSRRYSFDRSHSNRFSKQAWKVFDSIPTGSSWDCESIDLKNDGDEDVVFLNGTSGLPVDWMTLYTEQSSDVSQAFVGPVNKSVSVFKKAGSKMKESPLHTGLEGNTNARSMVCLDINQDGAQDLLMVDFNGKLHAYINDRPNSENRWISIRLVGDPQVGVNWNGIGAKIELTNSKGKRLGRKEIHGGGDLFSMKPFTQNFGVGRHKRVNAVVYWPNGKTSSFQDIKTNQAYSFDQRSGEIKRFPRG